MSDAPVFLFLGAEMDQWIQNLDKARAVRFSAQADEKICRAARLYGMSVAAFVRKATLEKAERLLVIAKKREGHDDRVS